MELRGLLLASFATIGMVGALAVGPARAEDWSAEIPTDPNDLARVIYSRYCDRTTTLDQKLVSVAALTCMASGFERMGDDRATSPTQRLQFYDTAELWYKRALALAPMDQRSGRFDPHKMRDSDRAIYTKLMHEDFTFPSGPPKWDEAKWTLVIENAYISDINTALCATSPGRNGCKQAAWLGDKAAKVRNEMEEQAAAQRMSEQNSRQEQLEKELSATLKTKKEAGDFVCTPDGGKLGYVENVATNGKIQIRLHHHEDGNVLTNVLGRDWDTFEWTKFDEVVMCKP
jgi:hypothetical protein